MKFLRTLLIVLAFYFLAAYFLVPDFWRHYAHHPELAAFPRTSFTAEGLAGDPLNAGLIASKEELTAAMKLAGWQPADTLSFSSDLKIAESVLLNESYPAAPVSRLYLFNRPQDMAFEKQAGSSPKQRHHARFWKTEIAEGGKPLWIGSATFDRSVGVSRTTGQITHHIDADIDRERDTLFEDLARAGRLSRVYQVSGTGPSLRGKNGSGDAYYTDGELTVGVVSSGSDTPVREAGPVHVELKNKSWRLMKSLLKNWHPGDVQ